MQVPLQISFRNMDPSDAMEAAIRDKAEKLEQFHDQIISCRVMVEAKHRRHHKGNHYTVRIDLTVPGRELAVSRDPAERKAYEDAYVALRDAFDSARRQLEDDVRRRRPQSMKRHEGEPQGFVTELHADHGRIGTTEGRHIYFHRNSLLNGDFEKLQIGAPVLFVEESGDEGPQASTVKLLGSGLAE